MLIGFARMRDAGFGLTGSAAAVIGAGQGIGRAIALLLARAGARVALVDEVEERALAVAREAAECGVPAIPLVADVTDASAAQRAVARADAELGGIASVINIVGSASWAPLLEMDEATWQRDFRVNLEQHWYVARAAAAQWQGAGAIGSLVVVASVSGVFSAPRHGAYGAAKAGLLSLVRTMAEEWWPSVRVNAVVPGMVRTPRIEAMWTRGEVARPADDALGRMAEPEDIANAAVFLSSPLAHRITGQALVVDGGTSARFPYHMT
ncbi:MAG TPA: SDR family NAD(P)-dependent oxidoreductase [Myxococcota bacterium]|nr:SDR family NAD(P)-dependent oxidoreductase [Myxococcota bacterium]